MRNRSKQLLAALALVAGATLVCCVFPPRRFWRVRFTETMVLRIHKGMTEEEVVAILGKPAGNYASPDVCFATYDDYRSDVWGKPEGRQRPDGTTEKAWLCDEGGVAVEFDLEGRVHRCYWEPMFRPTPRSFLDLVRLLFWG